METAPSAVGLSHLVWLVVRYWRWTFPSRKKWTVFTRGGRWWGGSVSALAASWVRCCELSGVVSYPVWLASSWWLLDGKKVGRLSGVVGWVVLRGLVVLASLGLQVPGVRHLEDALGC